MFSMLHRNQKKEVVIVFYIIVVNIFTSTGIAMAGWVSVS